ncbi:hypothetical protein UlMin_001935 [Ulmus minor]
MLSLNSYSIAGNLLCPYPAYLKEYIQKDQQNGSRMVLIGACMASFIGGKYFVYYLLFTLDDIVLCLPQLCLCEWRSLIIPKSHFPSLEATPQTVIAVMCSKVRFISCAIVKATRFDSFNLLVNNGESAGQVIFHTHIHIIPRKASDSLWASEKNNCCSITVQSLHGMASSHVSLTRPCHLSL